MLVRLIALAVLAAPVTVPGSMGARAQDALSPAVVCHDEATRRYIADFQPVGLRRETLDGAFVLVTEFQNKTLLYDRYFAECLERRSREKAR